MIRNKEPIKLALPKGRLLSHTAELLEQIGLVLEGYGEKTRTYRLRSTSHPNLSGKIFQEKDIPIQVAVGNYDLGICSLDWIEELQTRYPSTAIVKIGSFDFGAGGVYIACGSDGLAGGAVARAAADGPEWRIVSEYPNVAQRVALENRLPRFRVFPLWGAAEAYPPEDADLAVLWARSGSDLRGRGLSPLLKIVPTAAFLIGNTQSLEAKDLSGVLDPLSTRLTASSPGSRRSKLPVGERSVPPRKAREDTVRLALPDGHQQSHACRFLNKAQMAIDGYTHGRANRRPQSEFGWLDIKVIRPQDMPLQVANGNFDLAITGRDWLMDHRYQFPSTPVEQVLDLGFGWVRIVAAISRDVPADSIAQVGALVKEGELRPLRVASEYVNTADIYLWRNHIAPYRLIPTWGASEAFLPDDADLLIDNTETGKTLERHNLKIIDVLFESTARLIGNRHSLAAPGKRPKLDVLIDRFREALE
ncbi:MAG: ATP phosphoribosyltransferase [Chloroflexota bacterium]